MDKQQAKYLIKQTFENPFDKSGFISFIRNLLNHIEDAPFLCQGKFIPDQYNPYIASYERIGKYTDGEHKIDILIIKLRKETSLERARSMQRNFVAWYLNGSRGGELKDAALAAYISPDDNDWRFSLVKMDYRFEETENGKLKVKEEITPARRWSFLVGANENSHTAQSRLVNILADDEKSPTLSELEDAFNIETVTKEFFLKYRELFITVKEAMDNLLKIDARIRDDFEKKGVNTVDFVKKLMGQVIFLYFLQKKGWFGVERDSEWGDGSKKFLRELFMKKYGDYDNFFNDILEPLFYEALRNDRSHEDHYYSRFNCKIPFLNGGLFDPVGGYDWVHTDINLPNELFSNSRKTREGDIGDGILDIFDRYNFTVKEDEPLEKEVAIDPELLGKAYEKFNAIRPDNFEEYKKALKSGKKGEETKFNKQYGVYYTPREIVHYMCQQSLVNYLYNEMEESISKDDVEELVKRGEHVSENEERVVKKGRETKTYSFMLPESVRINAESIDRKLADITVCDPAVGSGAFPVGMMSEIVKTRNALSPFMNDKTRNPYEFKRRCIEHSLYGVDIDPGAVEIAKLRLWLSLIVDEEDIKHIKPLPNLDYKIVCGNSLLGYPYTPRGLDKIERLKEQFFKEVNPVRKNELRKLINDEIYGSFKDTEKTLGYKVSMDFKINFSEVFHEKGGFDVVIGNPPYKVISDNRMRNLYSESIHGRTNLYGLFIHQSIRNILKEKGILSFINPKTLLSDIYFINLRKYLKCKGDFIEIMKIIDRHNVFEEVLQATIIIFYMKVPPQKIYHIKITEIGERKDIGNSLNSLLIHKNNIYQSVIFNESLFCSNKKESYSLWEKMLLSSKSLSTLGLSFTTGKIQWDLFKDYLIEKALKGAFKLIWAENIQRYSFINSSRRKGMEYLKESPMEPNITTETIVTQRITADEQDYRIIATIFSPEEHGFNAFSENHTNYLEKKSDNLDIKYLLALLNSSLYDFIFRLLNSNTQVSAGQLNALPIRVLSKSQQSPFIKIVTAILLKKKADIFYDTSSLEKQIDGLVYDLYGLTEEEIAIVEGGHAV